jgi:hypothetical protein
MKSKFNQDGFGGLEIMLVLAVLLLVAGIGSYLYTKHHRLAVNTLKVATSPTSAAPGTAVAGSTSPGGIPASAGQKAGTPSPTTTTVIKISTEGFQITVPDSLKDLTYHITAGANDTDTITFSTAKLTAAVPACAADQKNGAFDIITRGQGAYPTPANPSSGALLKQYPGVYIAYTLPNAPCAKGLSTENQALLDDQAQAFYGALSTVQAIAQN